MATPHFLLVLLLAQVVNSQDAAATSWPTDGWRISTPAAEGLDAAPLDRLAKDVDAGTFGHVDRVFVARHGRVVFDRRWTLASRRSCSGSSATATSRRSTNGCAERRSPTC
jgi:hypothetical protein